MKTPNFEDETFSKDLKNFLMVPHHDLWIIWTSIFCGIFCSGRFFRKKKSDVMGKRCLLTIFNCPSQRQKGLEVQFAASAACQLPHGDFSRNVHGIVKFQHAAQYLR
eukprot:UN00024